MTKSTQRYANLLMFSMCKVLLWVLRERKFSFKFEDRVANRSSIMAQLV